MSKVDRTIIVSNLMNRYQIDIEKADKVYNQLSEKEKKQIMEIICLSKENCPFYQDKKINLIL